MFYGGQLELYGVHFRDRVNIGQAKTTTETNIYAKNK